MNKNDLDKYKSTLISFLEEYETFLHYHYRSDTARRNELQRKLSFISGIVGRIHGGGSLRIDSQVWSFYQQLGFSLQDGVSDYQYFDQIKSHVTRVINEAIGNIETGMIPDIETKPIIPIRDQVVKERCLDLLSAPGSFDRVIREATTILEDRLRGMVSREQLSSLIPLFADQTLEKLINSLLNPDNPVICIGENKRDRVAFYRMMQGICAYLRNPFHHSLNDKTEWALAWSVAGLIDSLLYDLAQSKVDSPNEDNRSKETK